MTGVIGACGLALSAGLLALLLSEIGYKGAKLLTVTAAFLLLAVAMERISDILCILSPYMDRDEFKEPIRLTLKVVGVGYAVGICRDTVDELGHKALGGALVTVGRLEILLIVAPKIVEVVRLAASLI